MNQLDNNKFTKNLDELLYLSTQKNNIVNFLIKNFKETIHYIINKNTDHIGKHGGHNKKIFMLSEDAFELLKNSYNLRNKYIIENAEMKIVNPIAMCIENQTIGFIQNCFKGSVKSVRQHIIGNYRIDLYFPKYKLVIECDENNHNDRDEYYEKQREEYILSLGNKIIRYNPNDNSFDLSNVLQKIIKIIHKK